MPPQSDGPLARLRAQLAGPRGPQRVEALLASDDAAAIVAGLSASELHALVLDVGLEEAGPLLALATPAQIQGSLDFVTWDRDRADLVPARAWMAALVELGFEKLGAVWAGLDAEWRVLFIQQHVVVYDLSGGEDPDHDITYVEDPEAPPVWFTPDRDFAVRLLGGEDAARLTMQLLDDLYRADLALARHTLLAARSEPTAELEETAYRWRSGRLADLGYVDFHEALELFAPLTPEQFAAQAPAPDRFADDEAHAPLPMALAEHVVARSFLARAWDGVAAGDLERLELALVVLVNKVLAAARVQPGDPDALAAAADYATATVALGLETVSRGDVARAAELLPAVSMTRLHRVGYTVTQRLAQVARGLAPRAATADDVTAAVLAGLAGPRPWLSRMLDDPPRAGVRPFESQADLRRAAELLAALALRVTIAEHLGLALAAMQALPEPRPDLDDHARTALARFVAAGDPTAEPAAAGPALSPAALSRGELVAARHALAAPGPTAFAPAATAALRHRLGADGGLTPLLAALVDGWLHELADTLLALDPTDPDAFDPRFVEGLLVAPGGGARA